MISEHISQTFMCNIRVIKYDVIHDGNVSIPTAENGLHRVLSAVKVVLCWFRFRMFKNQWPWSSALLDEARLVLSVLHIQTGDVRRSVTQSFVRGRPAPNQATPVLLVVWHSLRRATRRLSNAGGPGAGAVAIIVWFDAVRSVILIEVERVACKIHVSAGHSYWTYSDITIWTTAGNPTVHTQLVLQLVASEDVKKTESTDATICNFRIPRNSKNFLPAWTVCIGSGAQ